MQIIDFRTEKNDTLTRVSATIKWENNQRPDQEIYFATIPEFASDLACNPHAFLIGCIIPASRFGEERIYIDAEICPQLQNGLQIAMGWLCHWFGESRRLVRIEAKTQSSLPTNKKSSRAGFLFSGGVDSLAILRTNRLNYPLSHPGSMVDGVLVYGLEVEEEESFDYVVNSLSQLAEDAKINLIPIYTNIYEHIKDLDPNWRFWVYEYQGAALAAVAHTLHQRISRISIASSFDIPNVYPHGSHPLIDPYYSSYDFQIRYDDLLLSRLEKVQLLADWDVALKHLRVCNFTNKYQSGQLNCGKCEKCLRTMLALEIAGVLENATAFPPVKLTEQMLIDKAHITNISTVAYYQELINPLESIGRHDLAKGVQVAINRYHQKDLAGRIKKLDQKFFSGRLTGDKRDLKGMIKRFDSKFFHGYLTKAKSN